MENRRVDAWASRSQPSQAYQARLNGEPPEHVQVVLGDRSQPDSITTHRSIIASGERASHSSPIHVRDALSDPLRALVTIQALVESNRATGLERARERIRLGHKPVASVVCVRRAVLSAAPSIRHNDPVSRPSMMTSRIQLEPMTTKHLPLLAELDADAEVLRYILGRTRDASEVREFWGPICADTDADAVGLGWWIGRRRSDGDFLGWWDLSPSTPVPERPSQASAGWRLARRHWRQGYATEGAAKVLEHGFETVRLGTVQAETMAVNQPSRQVMIKLGMRHVRTDHRQWDDPLPGSEQGEVIYEISRDEWISAR